HEEPGRQIETPRALFDLWIDAAEEAYAGIALSEEFRQVYGRMVDAQMRLRAGMQRPVEQMCSTLGMPTRTEVDAAHREIVELERALRRLRDAVEGGPMPAAPAAPRDGARRAAKAQSGASKSVRAADKAPDASPSGGGARKASTKAAPGQSASTKAASKKTPSKAASSQKASSKTGSSKSPSSRPAPRKAAARTQVQSAKPAKPAAKGKPATRAARKLAPRPSVS